MMRKGIILSALIAILAGAGAIYWGSIAAPSIIAGIVEETNRDLSVPVADPSAKLKASKKYNGQSLAYLGNPEIVAKYPKDFVDRQRAMLLSLAEEVNKEPNQIVDRWIDIGLIKKAFDNYVGARDAWEYVKLISPQYALNYYNLGNLYGFYLGDFKKAETNFKKAIELSSTSSDFYLGLAGFYRDAYKEKYDFIDDLLLAGLKSVSGDPNLMMQLAHYYKSVGDKENAIKYFSQLLNSPSVSGAQKQAFQEEIATLSQ